MRHYCEAKAAAEARRRRRDEEAAKERGEEEARRAAAEAKRVASDAAAAVKREAAAAAEKKTEDARVVVDAMSPEKMAMFSLEGRDVQPALIGRHCVTKRDSAPVQYNDIL